MRDRELCLKPMMDKYRKCEQQNRLEDQRKQNQKETKKIYFNSTCRDVQCRDIQCRKV